MTILSTQVSVTRHSPAAVYSLWAAPESWAAWDPEVASVTFVGPPRVGARGRLKPAAGPALTFFVSELDHDRLFTNVGVLPGARLVFRHVVEPVDHGSTLHVTIGMQGPLAWLWRHLLARSMARAAQSSVDGLLTHLDRVSA